MSTFWIGSGMGILEKWFGTNHVHLKEIEILERRLETRTEQYQSLEDEKNLEIAKLIEQRDYHKECSAQYRKRCDQLEETLRASRKASIDLIRDVSKLADQLKDRVHYRERNDGISGKDSSEAEENAV